jgi:hypothetical protein
MLPRLACAVSLLLIGGVTTADEPASTQEKATETKAAVAAAKVAKADSAPNEPKTLSGMSILGNQEAPKSLVIVPWKSSQIGDPTTFSRALDDSTRPVDKEVFLRELAYYELKSKTE